MYTKFGFTKFTIQEFEEWISSIQLARTVLTIQHHHTYNPDYALFKGNNQFELQQGMKNFHVNQNGWNDIGQHFTTFPDGSIVSGRTLEKSPACIAGQNSNDICIEHLGNFDKGKDAMTEAHRETIIRMTAKLCSRFNLPVDTNTIVYHHWFDLSTGERNDGAKNNKSCPGTGFFGGNMVKDCLENFLPLVTQKLPVQPKLKPSVLKYVCVTATKLNIRTGSGISNDKVSSRKPASMGAVLRVYGERNGWYKISKSREHWVAVRYTLPVTRAKFIADTRNVHNGPGKSFEKLGAFTKGQEVFIMKEENNWCKLSMEEKWVEKDFLAFG